jgi:hypothetical protein
MRANHFARLLGMTALVAINAGCAPKSRTLNDDEKIVRAVINLTVAQGQKICLDDQTDQNSLAIFREMALAPRASRQELHWYPPTPLNPEIRAVQAATLTGNQTESASEKIGEPPVRLDFLPGLQQMMLNGAALRLSSPVGSPGNSVVIKSSWLPAGAHADWWPINRFRKDCSPRFSISNPVRNRDMAFVTVQANHWGALYALKRVKGDWEPMAEWSRWLY